MTLEEIRRTFSKPPAEYPKRLDNKGDLCPWCGTTTEYRRKVEGGQPSGWRCPGCKREGYFSVPYQIDPLMAGLNPSGQEYPCPECGNPVKNIWDNDTQTMKRDEWRCSQCRAQGKYQEIPF